MWAYYNTENRKSQAKNLVFGRQKRKAKREVELRKRRLDIQASNWNGEDNRRKVLYKESV